MSKEPPKSKALKLLAEDAEDLEVVAAALQDAVLKIGDIAWEAKARRLTLTLNRYRWGAAEPERVRAAVQVGSVLGVQTRRLRRNAREAVVELLTLAFEPGEAPGGRLVFRFAGDADLAVEVECIDLVLADVSEPWAAKSEPRHED
ncbi:DUF2948 family protein [Phenylobacterium sp.]|uniref:DUF2948 family protein n=1 Tax=Phenylobacterium sp. TaxID=1871053 RepID=UPI002FDE97D8